MTIFIQNSATHVRWSISSPNDSNVKMRMFFLSLTWQTRPLLRRLSFSLPVDWLLSATCDLVQAHRNLNKESTNESTMDLKWKRNTPVGRQGKTIRKNKREILTRKQQLNKQTNQQKNIPFARFFGMPTLFLPGQTKHNGLGRQRRQRRPTESLVPTNAGYIQKNVDQRYLYNGKDFSLSLHLTVFTLLLLMLLLLTILSHLSRSSSFLFYFSVSVLLAFFFPLPPF